MGNLVVAVVIAIVWMLITSRLSIESFLVGLVFGLLISLLSPRRIVIDGQQLPRQVVALVIYTLILARDIVLSGLDVARRVLSPTMPLNPGIIAVETQDEARSPLVAALSSDVITLTPGELVVEIEDNHILYVHCLDVERSSKHAAKQQTQRLKLLLRILGRSA
jgi:multicomponent Na+:H+ antiporter subunit E